MNQTQIICTIIFSIFGYVIVKSMYKYIIIKNDIKLIILSLKKFNIKPNDEKLFTISSIINDLNILNQTFYKVYYNNTYWPSSLNILDYINTINISLDDKLYKLIIIINYYHYIANNAIGYYNLTSILFTHINYSVPIDNNLKNIISCFYTLITKYNIVYRINELFDFVLKQHMIYYNTVSHDILIANYEYFYLQFYNNNLDYRIENFINNNNYKIINYFKKSNYSELRHLWIYLVGLNNAKYICWTKVHMNFNKGLYLKYLK